MALVSGPKPAGNRRRWLTCAALILLAVLSWQAWRQHDRWDRERQALRLLDAGEFDQAATVLEAASEVYPSDARLLFLAAVANRRGDHGAKFEMYLAKAERLGWPVEEVRLQRMLDRVQHGLADAASEAALYRISQEEPDDFTAEQIYEARAKGYMSVYQAPGAFQALGFWIEWRPDAVVPRLLRAQLYEQQNSADLARADYQAIVDAHPENIEARIRLAQFLLTGRKQDQALMHFQKCAEALPDDPRVILGLADIAYGKGEDLPGIERTLVALIQRDLEISARRHALRLLSSLYLSRKEYPQVISLLKDDAEGGRLDAPTFQSLIRAHTALNQRQLAEHYRQVQQRQLKLRDEALELDRKIRHNPGDPDLRFRQGKKYLEAGEEKGAVIWWYTALLAEPLHQASHEALRDYYAAQGDPVKAEQHQIGAERSVERTFELAWTAYTREDLNHVREAIPAIAAYPAYKPHADLLKCAVEVHERQNNLDPARVNALRPLLDYPRLRNHALTVLGSAMFQLGRFGEAESALLEVVNSDPNFIQAHRWLVAMNFDTRALDRVFYHCMEWARLDPTDYRPHRLMGLAAKLKEPSNRAINAYQESLRIDPNQPTRQEVLTELAECQYQLSRPEDAIKTLKLAEESVTRNVLLAQSYLSVSRQQEARALLDSALKQDVTHRLANTLRGDIAIQEGDYEAALKHLLLVTKNHPRDHTGWFKLSQVYSRLNQPDKARETNTRVEQLREMETRYNEAVERAFQAPDDVDIRRELAARARQLGDSELAKEWDRAVEYLESRQAVAAGSETAQPKVSPTPPTDPGIPPLVIEQEEAVPAKP